MINLLDFKNHTGLKKLLSEMGIDVLAELPPLTFIEKIIPSEGMEITVSDIVITDQGLVTVNDQVCCIYIKAQSEKWYDLQQNISSYKYHVYNCQTIQSMIESGRGARYVASKRDDGFFPVLTHKGLREMKLGLCGNCRSSLSKLRDLPNPFSLKEFYKKFKSEERLLTPNEYAKDHSEVATRYKKLFNYTCQFCNVNCTGAKHLLHMHHKDGNKTNNARENLGILCVACHADQPYHSQMYNDPQTVKHIEELKKIRTSQKVV